MAKASRSKKQPEFDANELDDLIFSPAVGTGVGSHLLSKVEPPVESGKTPSARNMPTVVMLKNYASHGLEKVGVIVEQLHTLQSIIDVATVGMSDSEADMDTVDASTDIATVDRFINTSTVDTSKSFDESRTEEGCTEGDEHIDLSTVDTSTVDRDISAAAGGPEMPREVSTVDMSQASAAASNGSLAENHENTDMSTIGMSHMGSGSRDDVPDTPNIATVATSKPIDRPFSDEPKNPHLPTVDTFKPGAARFSAKVKLWRTAEGELIPDGRVKKIRRAQDVINSAEEAVYNTLWRDPNAIDEGSARIIQAGYDYLTKQTRLARKTIQRIVAKLIDKGFIEVAKAADIYKRTSTVYRVFNYRTVLDRHQARGRHYVAKVGPGFSYVWELSLQPQSTDSDLSTVVNSNLSTVVNESPVTVVKMNLSTVVPQTTSSIVNYSLEQTSSSVESVYQALNAYGSVDDDAVHTLTISCRQAAPDCTDREIVYFIHQKGALIRAGGIRSPIGFLLRAVPKCFVGESFQLYRVEERKRLEREAETKAREKRELEEWRKEQRRLFLDPSTPESEKAFIRQCLDLPSEEGAG